MKIEIESACHEQIEANSGRPAAAPIATALAKFISNLRKVQDRRYVAEDGITA